LNRAPRHKLYLGDAFEKAGIDIPMTRDHVIKENFSMEEIEKITQAYAISPEELSSKLLDVFLLYALSNE
jgi:hypothetical protein